MLLGEGKVVVLEIDVQGARQVKARFPAATLVFLHPPSTEALEARLRGRGADNEEAIARRLDIARWELAQAGDFDHHVTNDRVDAAVGAIGRILDTLPCPHQGGFVSS